MSAKLARREKHITDPVVLREINRIDANDALLNAAIAILEAQEWRQYRPLWRGVTLDPVIGNGTLDGWYLLVGNLCRVKISITAGSATTFGTGAWDLTLPFQAWNKPTDYARVASLGSLYAQDTSVPQFYSGTCRVEPKAGFLYLIGTAGKLTSAYPFAWASGDKLEVDIEFPVMGS